MVMRLADRNRSAAEWPPWQQEAVFLLFSSFSPLRWIWVSPVSSVVLNSPIRTRISQETGIHIGYLGDFLSATWLVLDACKTGYKQGRLEGWYSGGTTLAGSQRTYHH